MSHLREQISEWNARALARLGKRPAESDSRRSPEPGDLFVLDETRAFPVEWALVEQDPEDESRWLAVAADLNPLVGSADVEVPAESLPGPLTLRCAIEVHLEKELIAAEQPTGTLGPEVVAKVRHRRIELAKGDVTSSALARETDHEAEYREWIGELDRARELLVEGTRPGKEKPEKEKPEKEKPEKEKPEKEKPEKEKSVEMVRRGRSVRSAAFGNPYSLAASILLVISLGLGGGVVWQHRELKQSDRRKRDAEATLREERRQWSETQERTEETLRQQGQELERGKEEAEEIRRRLAELEERSAVRREEPLVDVPFAWLIPSEEVRGPETILAVPPGTRFLWLLLDVGDTSLFPVYRLEIFEADNDSLVWSSDGLTRTGVREVSVALPPQLLGAGEYRLDLFGVRDDSSERVAEYALQVVIE